MFKYLAIGDIFMDGPELPEGAPTWPLALVEQLRGEGYEIADPVMVVGRQEITSRLLYHLRDAHLPLDFDLVTVQAGAWDIVVRTPPSLFEIATADLLGEAIKHAGGEGRRVILVTPPLFGNVNDESYLEVFAAMVKQQFVAVMEQETPHFVDVVETSIELLFGDDNNRTESGFPGPVAHRAWADQAAHPARHILGPPAPPKVVPFPGTPPQR